MAHYFLALLTRDIKQRPYWLLSPTSRTRLDDWLCTFKVELGYVTQRFWAHQPVYLLQTDQLYFAEDLFLWEPASTADSL